MVFWCYLHKLVLNSKQFYDINIVEFLQYHNTQVKYLQNK